MAEETEQALSQLKIIATHVGCTRTCTYRSPHFQNLIRPAIDRGQFKILTCKSKKGSEPSSGNNYDDILGPDQPPDSDWCEEVVVGVGKGHGCHCLFGTKLCR